MNGKSDATNHQTSNHTATPSASTPETQTPSFEGNSLSSTHHLQRAIKHPRTAAPSTILQLQRLYGNKAVSGLIQRDQKPSNQIQRLSATDTRKFYDKFVTKSGLATETFSAIVKDPNNAAAESEQIEELLKKAFLKQEGNNPSGNAIPTWDSKANNGDGAFVKTGGNYQPGVYDKDNNKLGYKQGADASDGRNFGGADSSVDAQFKSTLNISQVKSLSDIDDLDSADIQNVNPQSMTPYRILHNVLNQSWNEAKHKLANPEIDNQAKLQKRQALMRKLWEYRQWHHNEVLKEVQKEVNKVAPDGLTAWPSAGSTTLTSDIDVNLKGTQTELAVKIFNSKFKEGVPAGHVWDYEPGVVYDVNVYALDFMHGVKSENENQPNQKDYAKVEGGGFKTEAKKTEDAHAQNVWSYAKMRLYMTASQWTNYMKIIVADEAQTQEAVKSYNTYIRELVTGMKEAAAKPDVDIEADTGEDTGIDYINKVAEFLTPKSGSKAKQHAQAENIKMGASNRIYEEKLTHIKTLRTQLANIANNDVLFDETLLQLRDALSEAALFSNEAYLTGGSISHTVVGTQMGKKLVQTKNEVMQAVSENVADILKEIGRHGGSIGEAAYKSGKYIMRLTDAIRNLGLLKNRQEVEKNSGQESDGAVESSTLSDIFEQSIEPLYATSYEIAINIKGGGSQSESEKKAAEAMAQIGIKKVEELKQRVLVAAELASQIFNVLEEEDKGKEALQMAGKDQNKKLVMNTNK